MAIFVKDEGLKVRFSKKAASGFVQYAGDAEAFRQALANAGEESPKHGYMLKVWTNNGRLSIKSSNKYAKQLRSIAKVQASEPKAVKPPKQVKQAKPKASKPAVQTVEQAMAEAEQVNAELDKAIADIQRSNMPKKSKNIAFAALGVLS
jgi:hypothetical protein